MWWASKKSDYLPGTQPIQQKSEQKEKVTNYPQRRYMEKKTEERRTYWRMNGEEINKVEPKRNSCKWNHEWRKE